jgi:DNA-directed RNA polymerase specialized sigma24 family protein
VATRAALDELRRQKRRTRYEGLLAWTRAADAPATPEDVRSGVTEEQGRVRTVLSALSQRDAEFLLLRSQGVSYDEVANVLGMNPTSIGALLGRAQQAFRKENIKRYGQE